MSSELSAPSARVVFYNDPKVRSVAYQLALCVVVAFLVYGAASNAIENLARFIRGMEQFERAAQPVGPGADDRRARGRRR